MAKLDAKQMMQSYYDELKRLYSYIMMPPSHSKEMTLPHIKIATRGGMEISVSDRWNSDKRHKEGRINIVDAKGTQSDFAVSGSEAIALSNAFSKIAWEMARSDLNMAE